MFSRVGPLVKSMGEQVLSGMGLHVVAFSGSEAAFRIGVREAAYEEFLRVDVLGTDGRHGESIAQILEKIFDLDGHTSHQEFTEYLTKQGADVPDHQADLIRSSVLRHSHEHLGIEVAEVAALGIVRKSRGQPILLTIDNLGLGHLDLRLLLSIARFPHIPVLIALHLCGATYEEAPASVQRLTRMLGKRVVTLSEPREVIECTRDWSEFFEDSSVPDLREVTILAALLGRIPSPEVLSAVVSKMGFTIGPVQAYLQSAGVLTSSVHWQFSSYDEVACLRNMIVEQRDVKELAWMAVAETRGSANAKGATSSEVLLYADLCELAGEPALALAPLRHCALGFHLGEPDIMSRLVEKHAHLLSFDDHPGDRLAQEYVSLRIAMTLNESNVESRAQRLLEDAQEQALPNLAANALRVLAIAAWNRDEFGRAQKMMEEASCAHAVVEDWSHAGQDHLMLGWWNHRREAYCAAYEAYYEAIRCFEIAQDEGRVAEGLALIGISLIAENKFEEATLVLDKAWLLARRVASSALCADILNSRAEIARAQSDWESAHEYASQAHAWFQLIGHRFAHVAQFNLGLIALGAHRFGDARAILEEIRAIYPKAGLESRLPLVNAALAVCALAWRDMTGFDESLFPAETAISVGFRHPDFPWILNQGLLLAERTGQEPARERLADLIALFAEPD
jgi:tetratricopeptide (TPR) repeat protein